MLRRFLSTRGPSTQRISREIKGDKSGDFFLAKTPNYRVFVLSNGRKISPWHDLPAFPLSNDTREAQYLITMVNEIPRGSTAKMEVATKEEGNPIKQDINKKTKALRDYPFTSLVNYGMVPQTWEHPKHAVLEGIFGDNDPVDVCDVGAPLLEVGQVVVCKVLGVMGMVDEGEMDWKVIAINREDPKSAMINTIQDLERVQPGKVKRLMDWFKQYKVPDGKPLNTFAFDDQVKDADFAMRVIHQCHQHWRDVPALKEEGLWIGEELETKIEIMKRREQHEFDRKHVETEFQMKEVEVTNKLIDQVQAQNAEVTEEFYMDQSKKRVEQAQEAAKLRIEKEKLAKVAEKKEK